MTLTGAFDFWPASSGQVPMGGLYLSYLFAAMKAAEPARLAAPVSWSKDGIAVPGVEGKWVSRIFSAPETGLAGEIKSDFWAV